MDMRVGVRRRLRGGVLVLVALSAALSGCGGPADGTGAGPNAVGGGLREDPGPVRARFPEFGDFEAVVWRGEALGDGGGRSVPGPTDVRMSGVVRLGGGDAAQLRKRYAWREAAGGPRVPGGLATRIPAGARWWSSADFTRAVTDGRHPASFHVDLDRRVLVFDAVNPARAD
ncbi:hypothetical protein [Streptomyces sp. enrichment culture]|uniref:hypothetical protein n=1 Tax=Streptomyces sp. enrichment culture TaxID=1795815 RepID=UPI003F54546C